MCIKKKDQTLLSLTTKPDKSCYFLGYLQESPMSFVVKDAKSGRVLVRDTCVISINFPKMFSMELMKMGQKMMKLKMMKN